MQISIKTIADINEILWLNINRIDLYFRDSKLTVQIAENVHSDRNIGY